MKVQLLQYVIDVAWGHQYMSVHLWPQHSHVNAHQSMPGSIPWLCRNSFGGDNATYWSYPFNKLYKRVGAPDVTLGVDSVGNLLQTGKHRARLSMNIILPSMGCHSYSSVWTVGNCSGNALSE